MKKNFLLIIVLALTFVSCELESDVTFTTVTFEDASSESLANSINGTNLYGGDYPGFYDLVSDLELGLFSENFYEGGVVLSQWNDTTTVGYTNQCSVFFNDPSTGFGGHNSSKTFALSYGSDNSSYLYGSDTRTFAGFRGNEVEKVFDHFYVNNSTYAVRTMRDGDSFSSPLGYENSDWFKLIISGLDKNGNETGNIEFYLADFRNNSSCGIVTEWTKVDLYMLGMVNKLRFDLKASVETDYGISIPTYFCFDDIAIRD